MDHKALMEQLIAEGISQVGFCSLEGCLPDRYRHFTHAVVLVYRLLDGVMDEVEQSKTATFTYFHHYRTVNSFLDRCALWTATMLERAGYHALPVGASQSVHDSSAYSGTFQHKTAAVQAGLGWIGKSALFVSPLYGPRVRLVTILTDMPLPKLPHPELKGRKNGCGDCRLCAEKCPAMAIRGNAYVPGVTHREDIFDPKACSEYMKETYKMIGRGSVCGICVSVCPYGRGDVKQK